MQWTTGPKLFQRFELHLQGTHLLTWQTQTFGANQTVAIFNGHLEVFKDSLLAGYNYEEQKDYLRLIRNTVAVLGDHNLLRNCVEAYIDDET